MTNQLRFSQLALVLGALYFAQGIPGGLIAHAMPVFLREAGASLALIGSLKLLALPWLLKVFWAPWVDRKPGLRWLWILRMQTVSACCFFLLALLQPGVMGSMLPLLAALLVLNLASATQDISTDGLAASLTPATRLGWINTLQVAGYKVGMLVGGSGLLLLSVHLSLSFIYLAYAGLLVLLMWPLYQHRHETTASTVNGDNTGSVSTTWLATFKGFLTQRNILLWIMVLLSYKLSDSLGSTMLKPMLVDLGFDRSLIASLTVYSTIAGLVGAAIGGWLYAKAGARVMLITGALLQGLSVSAFGFIPSLDWQSVQWLVGLEQLCDGVSTVVLFAWMMRWCRAGQEGSDYTLQASLQIVLSGVLGALSGALAGWIDYKGLYLLCGVLSVFSVMVVLHFLAAWSRQPEMPADYRA